MDTQSNRRWSQTQVVILDATAQPPKPTLIQAVAYYIKQFPPIAMGKPPTTSLTLGKVYKL